MRWNGAYLGQVGRLSFYVCFSKIVVCRLSILWTQEKRFIFSDGEEAPPTGFLWDEEEFKLGNKLLELMTDSERGVGESDDV